MRRRIPAGLLLPVRLVVLVRSVVSLAGMWRAWPLDAEDTHVYGGLLLIALGTGLHWGWWSALVVAGSALVLLGVGPHLLNARRVQR